MPVQSFSTVDRWRTRLTPPPPDSREGLPLVAGLAFAAVYILVLIAYYTPMTSGALSFDVTTLSLVVSLICAFALSTMLGQDISTFQRLELELARTVLAYVGSGTPPPSDAPLAGVWRAHVAAAEESRRMARAHAYALGIFIVAGILSLIAALLTSLGIVSTTRDLIGLGMFVEWFAFTLLAIAAVAVSGSVGFSEPVSVYEVVSPRRYRRNSGRQQAVEGAVSEIAWLSEFSRGARESRVSPSGPPVIPSWHE